MQRHILHLCVIIWPNYLISNTLHNNWIKNKYIASAQTLICKNNAAFFTDVSIKIENRYVVNKAITLTIELDSKIKVDQENPNNRATYEIQNMTSDT